MDIAAALPDVCLPAVLPIVPAVHTLFILLLILVPSIVSAFLTIWKPKGAWQILRFFWHQRMAVLSFGVGLALIWMAADWISSRTLSRTVPGPASWKGSWPTARGSLQRLGSRPNEIDASRAGLNWSFGQRNEAFYASPAVIGDRVYIIGSRGDQGRIYCLDARSGHELWSCRPSGYRATFSSPVVAHDLLVCGEGLHRTQMARVICVDLHPQRAGKIAWTFQTNSHVECTPTICHGRVFVNAGDDGVYCLRLDPTVPDEDRVVWHAQGGHLADAETALAVWQNRVYVGLGMGGAALCVLDADSGQEIQRVKFDFPVFGLPMLHDAKLFVGMGHGNYVEPSATPGGQLCCLDAITMELLWKYQTPDTILGSAIVVDDRILFACRDGWLYQLDLDGQLIRKWNSHSPIVVSPAAGKQQAYLVNEAGILCAVNLRTLQPVWYHAFAAAGAYVSSPVIAKGRVYVGTPADGFVCIGAAESRELPATWPGHLGGPGRAGVGEPFPLADKGKVSWYYPADSQQREQTILHAPVAACDDCLLAPLADGPRLGLVRLDIPPRADDQPRERWFSPTPHGIGSSPTIAQGKVLFVDGASGDDGRHLYCVDLETGKTHWMRGFDRTASGHLAVASQGVIVQPAQQQLACIDLNNQIVWQRVLPGSLQSLNVTRQRVLAATTQPAALTYLDGPTGQMLWKTSIPDGLKATPIVSHNKIYLGTAAGIEVRRLVDGSPVTTTAGTCPGVDGEWHFNGDALIYQSSRGQLVQSSLAPSDVWKIIEYDPDHAARGDHLMPGSVGLSPLPAGAPFAKANPLVLGTQVLHLTRRGLMRTSLDERTPGTTLWLSHEAFSRATTPLVARHGNVYFGVAEGGLVCIRGMN